MKKWGHVCEKSQLGAYWKIVRRIFEVEQQSQRRAAYGSRLLERLLGNLNSIYSRGFSVQSLRKMRGVTNSTDVCRIKLGPLHGTSFG